MPGAVKEARDVPRAVEEWEMKCARVRAEYGKEEGLTDGMRVAVLMMLPKDLQEMVFQMGKG